MSLKELTKDKHTAAEKTAFMKAVFSSHIPREVWISWTFNKMHWYNAIEVRARDAGLLDDLPGIERTYKLYKDFKTMVGNRSANYSCNPLTERYCDYIMDLEKPEDIMAHLYVWHMGDLFGGQMIKNVLGNFSHHSLEFNNKEELIANIRTKLDDSMAEEANKAFDFAIEMMSHFVFSTTDADE